MKISRITVNRYAVPLEPPFSPSWDSRPRTRYEATIVRVDTDEGLTGFGSGDGMPELGPNAELFIGQDPRDIARHAAVITNLSFHGAKHWALDLALWDLLGKIEGKPVWQLLGGTEPRLKAYASLGQRRGLKETVDAVGVRIAEGFEAVKLRFWRDDWREEVAIVEAVRRAYGDAVVLMIDCNQAWRMPWDTAAYRSADAAIEIIRALAPFNIYWLEEPVFRGDYVGLRRLCRDGTIRIAGGELTREPHESRFLVEHGCYHVLQSDAAYAGGISGLAPVARLAHEKGVIFTPHTWGNGIMIWAALQLTAGTGGAPYIELPCDPPYFGAEARDFMLTEPICTGPGGVIELSHRPGLGFDIDEDRLRETRL